VSVLLAVDPGIDVTGWATFRMDGPKILVLQQSQGRFLAKGSLRTSPTEDLVLRVGSLASQLTEVIVSQGARWVAIEQPAISGVYQRHQGQRGQGFITGTMGLMHVATGALILAARLVGALVVLVPASRRQKALRHRDVYLLWPHLRHASNADERDAVHVGLQLLTDSRRSWEAAG
jgi:hypothetical protein